MSESLKRARVTAIFLRFQEITQMVLEPGTLVPVRSRQYLVEEVSPASNPGEQTLVRLSYIDVMIPRAHRRRQKGVGSISTRSARIERVHVYSKRLFNLQRHVSKRSALPFNRPETVCPGPGVTGIGRVVAEAMQNLSETGKKAVSCDDESNENFFYAFLRNRLPAEASDFPLFMGK
jgi:hypothetical protein